MSALLELEIQLLVVGLAELSRLPQRNSDSNIVPFSKSLMSYEVAVKVSPFIKENFLQSKVFYPTQSGLIVGWLIFKRQ